MRLRLGLAAACCALGLATAARADDQPFVTLYTTDIDTQGEREMEHWLTWASGNSHQAFNDILWRSEIEVGITDDLQGSLYLIDDWSKTRPHAPFGPAETQNDVGVSGELIWRLMNVYFDPFGLAVYVEPRVGTELRSVETKLLLQKNFFNDTLRLAGNINLEDRWEHDPAASSWDSVSALEFDAGAAYNITPEWSIGLEFDNERGFDGEVLGTGERPRTDSYYLGPTIQYLGHPWAITVGAQTQLPIASNPAHIPGDVVGGTTATDEHVRLTLRVTRDF